MFAYCGNNPVLCTDSAGNASHIVVQKAVNDQGGLSCVGHTVMDQTIHGIVDNLEEIGLNTAAIGASLLGFYESDSGIYHANTFCWQMLFGYNDLYDLAFDIGTCMDVKKFPFDINGYPVVIWVWKGDYLNLGAGAELGIYLGSYIHGAASPFLSMPMSMTLSYGGNTIISHSQTTWWITGFNSNYRNVHASHLSATFTIDFTTFSSIYQSFYNAYNGSPGWVFDYSRSLATYYFY